MRSERGQGLIELIITMVVISIALLALGAAFDAAFLSLHQSARTAAGANLGEQQLEMYAAIPYASLGLDTTTLATVKANDTTYVSDEATLNQGVSPTPTDVTLTCGTTSHCMPVQCTPAATCTYPVTLAEDPTGSDNRHYKVETFIRSVTQTTTEIMVTVIVRDPNQTGSPIVYQASTAFDPCTGC
jgi:type II secretory pathway pseudopilin PulG